MPMGPFRCAQDLHTALCERRGRISQLPNAIRSQSERAMKHVHAGRLCSCGASIGFQVGWSNHYDIQSEPQKTCGFLNEKRTLHNPASVHIPPMLLHSTCTQNTLEGDTCNKRYILCPPGLLGLIRRVTCSSGCHDVACAAGRCFSLSEIPLVLEVAAVVLLKMWASPSGQPMGPAVRYPWHQNRSHAEHVWARISQSNRRVWTDSGTHRSYLGLVRSLTIGEPGLQGGTSHAAVLLQEILLSSSALARRDHSREECRTF